ncbi:uncharacterized protein LOC120350271 [Nilaparvata lugens]|uniref:uncharacterized protein LOC120350271 n=1 Tax=Nilaparvata lugens TaxID=108931 RepID=UPI00193E9E17|nr:uncharacterized protein LOC120350271 [Nilaparvata lugens]
MEGQDQNKKIKKSDVGKARKRQYNEENWKKTKAKLARNQPKGQPRMPSCGHTKSASYKCDQLSRRDIEHFHRIIYAKPDKIYQDSMMLKYCSVSAPKRSRVEKVGSSRKGMAVTYSVKKATHAPGVPSSVPVKLI